MNVILVIALLLPHSPDSLSLEECYSLAELSYPLQRQIALRDSISSLKAANFATGYLPQIRLQAQATYQSEVPALQLPIPGAALPELKRDNYNVAIGLSQQIYDGGTISGLKSLEVVQSKRDQQDIRVELYRQRERIDWAYFALLELQIRRQSLQILQEDLRNRLRQLEALIRHGASLAGGADILKAELLRIEQSQVVLQADRRSARLTLSELIDSDLKDDIRLRIPTPDTISKQGDATNRPEYMKFELNRQVLNKADELESRRFQPKISAFANAAYGRPGFDFFETDLRPYATVGLQAEWHFWDWNARNRNREIVALQRQMLDTQEETFTKNLTIRIYQQRQQIAMLKEQLQRDREIIALRTRITRLASSQLEGGVITMTQFLSELHAEHQARLELALHDLQLKQALTSLRTTLGE